MIKNQRPLRVFLCHASGDKPAVRDLYHRLRLNGINPWLDEEDLVPGQDWQSEIPKAVHAADVVIVCLSHTSITKKGYVQKETKHALDAAYEQPEGTIFLIPLKIEECDIPEQLRRWHWVNYFEEQGYKRLMSALRLRAISIGSSIIEPSPLSSESSSYTKSKINKLTSTLHLDSPKIPLSGKPQLHLVWICDVSGSMQGRKIATLNHALREAIPYMRTVANKKPNTEVFIRAIKFSDGATWHIMPTSVAGFDWIDLHSGGVTDLGSALSMVAGQLMLLPLDEQILPPILVLITDGQPTDDYSRGLQALMAQHWGKKALRIAISIGSDTDDNILQKFIDCSDMKPLQASGPNELYMFVNWIATSVLQSALMRSG